MKIELDKDDIVNCLLEHPLLAQIIERVFRLYMERNSDIYDAFEKKVIESLEAAIPVDLNAQLQDAFTQAIVQVEFKHKSNIEAIERKLEALSRNIDALASRL